MAYITGTLISGQDLLNTIVTSMTDNGWTLIDTVAQNDKVLFSAGTDGYQNMYIRVRNTHMRLNYDGYVSGFSIGDFITGATSGATATVVGVTENGSSGILDIVDINGYFINNENITSTGGSAFVMGPPLGAENINTFDLDNIMNTIYFSMYSYWDTATNTGINERSHFGPYYIYGAGGTATPPTGYQSTLPGLYMVHKESDGSTRENAGLNIIKIDDLFFRDGTTIASEVRGGALDTPFQKFAYHDSYRRFVTLQYSNSALNALTYADIPSRDMQTIRNFTGNLSSAGYSAGIIFHDRNSNTSKRFYYNTTGNTFRVFDIDTGEEEIIGLNPFTGTSVGTFGCRFAYDGNRYIYAIMGSPLEFKRFDIVTQTWANMANSPLTLASLQNGYEGAVQNGIYVPANTVSGGGLWAEDRILFLLGSTAFLQAYNVESNSWTSNAITLPAAPGGTAQNSLYSDGERVFYSVGTYAVVYSVLLSEITGAWSQVYRDPRWQAPISYMNSTSVFSPKISKVQFRTDSPFDYGILVSDETVVVWTSPNNKYYWAYVGNYEKYENQPFAVTQSAHAASTNISVQVSSTANFEIGQNINILNTGTGESFVARINDITTDLAISSPRDITPGMWVFRNKSDFVITGDTECGITMYDEGGVSQVYVGNNDVFLEDSSSRKYPLYGKRYRLENIELNWPFDVNGRSQKKGRLTGVYSLSGNTSGIKDRSIVRDSAGNVYLTFMPQKRKLLNENMIAIGPIT